MFRYGDQGTQVYSYCDAEQPIVMQGVTFKPIPIDRTKITTSGTLDKANVTITTPQDSELADLYLIYPPSAVTTLVMYQGHVDDPDDDFRVIWSGRVMACARKGSKAEFTCEPVSTSLRRNGLRRRYQFGCPHELYGPDCRASKIRATINATVTLVQGARITLPQGWNTIAAEKYVGGLCEWINDVGGREVRTILKMEGGGNTALLSGTTRGMSQGQTVSMVLGCNHKAGVAAQPDGDCQPLHANVLNFGGQMFIPFKSPIAFGVNQYYGG
nr:DUF2163 domain-containing protein [Sphingomonas sp. TREG-RG-20F-R18-01]